MPKALKPKRAASLSLRQAPSRASQTNTMDELPEHGDLSRWTGDELLHRGAIIGIAVGEVTNALDTLPGHMPDAGGGKDLDDFKPLLTSARADLTQLRSLLNYRRLLVDSELMQRNIDRLLPDPAGDRDSSQSDALVRTSAAGTEDNRHNLQHWLKEAGERAQAARICCDNVIKAAAQSSKKDWAHIQELCLDTSRAFASYLSTIRIQPLTSWAGNHKLTEAGREDYADQLVRQRQPPPERESEWTTAALNVADVTSNLADYILITERESYRCTGATCEDETQYVKAAARIYAQLCGN